MSSPSFLPRPDHRLAFLRGFLENPKEVGSIIPSSRFLERRIVNRLDLAEARLVVELGPGTGGTTKAVLQKLRPDATLLSIEINPSFMPLLQTIKDPRFIPHHGSATEIPDILAAHALQGPDVIFSGIPFSTMSRELGTRILESAREALAPDGRFVAYQFRDRVYQLGLRVFGEATRQTELLNVPPMRVWRWDQPSTRGRPKKVR
ncbi:MAG: rRNA adenine N-6-methyltransferase family protein [Myxococcota bacterium]|nr:rRNA adenine N-6-methyltransferase family protein [Myxococcota bacterium]